MTPVWTRSGTPVPYPEAMAEMEAHVDAMIRGETGERIWLLEHPPLYTGGTSADKGDLLTPDRFPVFETRRGGQYTYHGPGQRVVYLMLDLNRRGRDVRAYVAALEAWMIATLAEFGVTGVVREGRVGVWVVRPEKPPLPDGSPRRTRSPPSVSASAAGSPSTGSPSTWSPTSPTTTGSCPAASRATVSPASSISACR